MCVTSLIFALESSEKYDSPAPVVFSTSDAVFDLSCGILSVELTSPSPTVDAGISLVQPVLSTWEIETEIREPTHQIRFHPLARSRPESSGEPRRTGIPELVVLTRHYPPAPQIRVTPTIDAIWARFKYSRHGLREPLLASAYFALSLIEREFGGRPAAARINFIEPAVLSKLGELTSTRGGYQDARKAPQSVPQPLSTRESNWIDHAVRSILINVGISAAGQRPSQLTIAQLPPI